LSFEAHTEKDGQWMGAGAAKSLLMMETLDAISFSGTHG